MLTPSSQGVDTQKRGIFILEKINRRFTAKIWKKRERIFRKLSAVIFEKRPKTLKIISELILKASILSWDSFL